MERREASVPRHGTQGASLGAWRAALGGRARLALNLATIEGMTKDFEKGVQAAINKVMKQQPAIFLKMLVLLVPRELEVSHSGTIKQMTDQQIEDAIVAIKAMMERKVIDVTPTTSGSEPAESEPEAVNPLK